MNERNRGSFEDYRRTRAAPIPDRRFGLVLAAWLAAGSIWPLLHGQKAGNVMLPMGVCVLAAALFAPRILAPLNRLFRACSLAVNLLSAELFSFVLFFFIFTPLAVLFRMAGRKPMPLAPDPGISTYWTPRNPSVPLPEDMRNQF